MESYNDIKLFSKSIIYPISYDFTGTSIKSYYLYDYLYPLIQDCTLEEMNQNLIGYCKKLKLLKMFDECNVEVNPGKKLNTASVNFNLLENQSFGATLDTKADPFRVYAKFCKRRSLRRANKTSFIIGLHPKTCNLDYEAFHLEKLGFFKDLEQKFVIGRYTSSLDINLLEKSDVVSMVFKSLDGKHQIQYGKAIRKNLVDIQSSSKKLVNMAPAVTDKNFFKYTLKIDRLKQVRSGPFGWYLALSNELATGKDLFFHKISTDFCTYLRVIDDLYLMNSFQCGFFMPWPSTKIQINDNFRITNFKGFDRIGEREPPHDSDLINRSDASGDHFGSKVFASLQTKLLLYKFSLFSKLGLRPFLYGSLAYLKERPGVTENLRGAVGFGFNFILKIGYFEVVYTSKAWGKSGDMPAEIQLLIYPRY